MKAFKEAVRDRVLTARNATHPPATTFGLSRSSVFSAAEVISADMQTQLVIGSSIFDEIVTPDLNERQAERNSLRKAFYSSRSLFHCMSGFMPNMAKQPVMRRPSNSTRRYAPMPIINFFRDVANAVKHLKLTRDPRPITHAANAGQTRGHYCVWRPR
jgi:hypothetical protein